MHLPVLYESPSRLIFILTELSWIVVTIRPERLRLLAPKSKSPLATKSMSDKLKTKELALSFPTVPCPTLNFRIRNLLKEYLTGDGPLIPTKFTLCAIFIIFFVFKLDDISMALPTIGII